MKIKELTHFHNELMKGNGLAGFLFENAQILHDFKNNGQQTVD
jgi:hypothetical protein